MKLLDDVKDITEDYYYEHAKKVDEGCRRNFWIGFILFLSVGVSLFTCSCTKPTYVEPQEILVDIDQNIYHVGFIGNQMWMLENLIVDHYNDNTNMPAHNDGKYTFYMVETTKICPLGWHVPKSWEWAILADYIKSNDMPSVTFDLGYWWSSSNIIEGYQSPQARAWYLNNTESTLLEFPALKEELLSIRCIKD